MKPSHLSPGQRGPKLLLACLLAAGLSGSVQAEYTLVPLGMLEVGLASEAYAINERGDVTGQTTDATGTQAFLWTAAGGMLGLGRFAGSPIQDTRGRDINDLGQITGFGVSGNGQEAFVWDELNGMVGLGDLPGGEFLGAGLAINNLGQIVGWCDTDLGVEAFIWDADNGMRGMGDLPGGIFESRGRDINDVGNVVGLSIEAGSFGNGFYWKPATGMTGIGFLPGAPQKTSIALGLNNLNQVVGGSRSASQESFEAYLWDERNGMTGLGDLPGGRGESYATGINDRADVVGWSDTDLGSEAFIWTAERGMTRLVDLVTDGSAAGWLLTTANDINSLGQIVGAGVNPQGRVEAVLLVPVAQPCP